MTQSPENLEPAEAHDLEGEGFDPLANVPNFETMYLEVQARTDGSTPTVDEVLAQFRALNLAGVAVAGSSFGLGTPVIAQVAITLVDDEPVAFTVNDEGGLAAGQFTGDVCFALADALNTVVVADEFVQYSPASTSNTTSDETSGDGSADTSARAATDLAEQNKPQDREPEFIELDPRRQSIEQPPGFPNEWRVSPHKLDSRGFVFVLGTSDFAAEAIAHDTGTMVRSAEVAGGRLIELPRGGVELPVEPTDDSRMPVVLFAQAGEAKYVHLVLGKARKRLRLTVANLPKASASAKFPSGSPAAGLLSLIEQSNLVAGPVQFDHPAFPYELLPAYERLTDPANTHAFFGEVAELLGVPSEVSQYADSGRELPSTGLREHAGDSAPRKRGWFRR